MLVAAGASACGGLVSITDAGPDGSTDARGRFDTSAPPDGTSPGDALSDAPSDRLALDAAACGSLGALCCEGAACNGSLVCLAGRCSCKLSSDCPDDGTCTASGQCLVTVSGGAVQFRTNSIALDAHSVYWANGGSGAYGSVVKAPLAGGAPETLAANLTLPVNLVESGGLLYWEEQGPTLGIGRMAVTGGTVEPLISGPPGAARDIAVDTEFVYWTAGSIGGTVQEIGLSGGVPTTLASEQQDPLLLALGSSDVYWSDDYGINVVSKAGGKSRTISSACADAPIVVDTSNVYCLSAFQGVLEVSLAGGTVTTLAPAGDAMSYSGAILPEEIAIDDDTVYWVSYNGLMRVPQAGGATTTLSTQGGTAIAVNDTSVYWATGTSEGKILMLSPK